MFKHGGVQYVHSIRYNPGGPRFDQGRGTVLFVEICNYQVRIFRGSVCQCDFYTDIDSFIRGTVTG